MADALDTQIIAHAKRGCQRQVGGPHNITGAAIGETPLAIKGGAEPERTGCCPPRLSAPAPRTGRRVGARRMEAIMSDGLPFRGRYQRLSAQYAPASLRRGEGRGRGEGGELASE